MFARLIFLTYGLLIIGELGLLYLNFIFSLSEIIANFTTG